MIILTLDTGTNTGWACGNSAVGQPEYGLHILPKTGNNVGRFLTAYEKFLMELFERFSPEHVCYEKPVMVRKTSYWARLKLDSLAGMTEYFCDSKGIECSWADAKEVKKHFTGNGSAKKYLMVQMAQARGWKVTDHNVADALAVFDYATHFIAPQAAARFDPLNMRAS